MKDKKIKTITITSKDISQKQWTNLLLELNLMKTAWKNYAKLEIQAQGLKKILAFGTRTDVSVTELDD
jgi:hypothetical protein|tara:strand:- start:112 stop:315 length:204 start_codon:yes stop_codon:yes gene_type:complete